MVSTNQLLPGPVADSQTFLVHLQHSPVRIEDAKASAIVSRKYCLATVTFIVQFLISTRTFRRSPGSFGKVLYQLDIGICPCIRLGLMDTQHQCQFARLAGSSIHPLSAPTERGRHMPEHGR